MSDNHEITVWQPTDLVVIPAGTSTPTDVLRYATPTLSPRDQKSIAAGFDSESYEMVATFVWAKASAALKRQLATLGMEFVGEMLGRSDFIDESDPSTSISDIEAISLAEDLGLVTTTQSMRLKHSLEIVTHFANLEFTGDTYESMEREEALSLLKACITSILGKARFENAIHFVEFRKSLSERSFNATDSEVQTIKSSPYFFIRTTVTALLSLVKTDKGAALEHAVGNTTLIVPILWDKLKTQEKWQVGQAYAEVNSAGNRPATAGLKRALTSVHGFDYVPESLRSNTFIDAAAKVLDAHFGINNFHNEAAPMSNLASLGTTIPKPAFGKCIEATLAVWLGNSYGQSWTAIQYATNLLTMLRPEQWEYYINECLPRDKTLLDKLNYGGKPASRWPELVKTYNLSKMTFNDKTVRHLLHSSTEPHVSLSSVSARAAELRTLITT
ncbi:hypothetical protein SAMN05444166_3150 [Singulisphaera sp. GP187]|uniref:hypothetical protein n=1 Tax=Singulisphaera sp. GP187 TaxID=1882752 RepID=UPI00092A7ACF|nr:hypothetical protein [Singulisphaera sp. GP187]SIO23507.1 hypothetical protein SAMN05444166_3150 [Singulisphaera sp. GP187]